MTVRKSAQATDNDGFTTTGRRENRKCMETCLELHCKGRIPTQVASDMHKREEEPICRVCDRTYKKPTPERLKFAIQWDKDHAPDPKGKPPPGGKGRDDALAKRVVALEKKLAEAEARNAPPSNGQASSGDAPAPVAPVANGAKPAVVEPTPEQNAASAKVARLTAKRSSYINMQKSPNEHEWYFADMGLSPAEAMAKLEAELTEAHSQLCNTKPPAKQKETLERHLKTLEKQDKALEAKIAEKNELIRKHMAELSTFQNKANEVKNHMGATKATLVHLEERLAKEVPPPVETKGFPEKPEAELMGVLGKDIDFTELRGAAKAIFDNVSADNNNSQLSVQANTMLVVFEALAKAFPNANMQMGQASTSASVGPQDATADIESMEEGGHNVSSEILGLLPGLTPLALPPPEDTIIDLLTDFEGEDGSHAAAHSAARRALEGDESADACYQAALRDPDAQRAKKTKTEADSCGKGKGAGSR